MSRPELLVIVGVPLALMGLTLTLQREPMATVLKDNWPAWYCGVVLLIVGGGLISWGRQLEDEDNDPE